MIFGTTVGESDKATKQITIFGQKISDIKISLNSLKNIKLSKITDGIKSIGVQAVWTEIKVAALNAALSLMLSMAATYAVSAFTDWIHESERATQEAEEFRQKQAELRKEGLENSKAYEKESKELDSIIGQYLKLASSTTNINSIKNDLSKLQEQLIDKYGDEANGIDLVNKSLEKNIELTIEKQQLDNKEWQRNNYDQIQAAKDYFGIKNYSDIPIARTQALTIDAGDNMQDAAITEGKIITDAVLEYIKDKYPEIVDDIYLSVTQGVGDKVSLSSFINGDSIEKQKQAVDAIVEGYEYAVRKRSNISEYFNNISDIYSWQKEFLESYEAIQRIQDIQTEEKQLDVFEADKETVNRYRELISKATELKAKLSDTSTIYADRLSASRELQITLYELQQITDQYPVIADKVESALNGIGVNFDNVSATVESATESWKKSLDEAQKGVLTDIDKIKSAMQTLAGGGTISSKDFWEIAGLDENGVLSGIKVDNGEFQVGLTSLMNLKDSLIQGEIESYQKQIEQIQKEHQNIFDEIKADANEITQIQSEISEKNIDTNQTVFGNIDTDTREILEWTYENLSKYNEAIESWGATAEDLVGSVSTVFGTYGNYDGIDIAFSPILQTSDGAVLLSKETVDQYIFGLIDEAGEGWTNEDLFRLDTTGLEIDGQIIKNLIADIGETSDKTSEAMHYVGSTGALARAKTAYEDINDSAKEYLGTINNCNIMIEYLNSLLGDTVDRQKALEEQAKKLKEEVSALEKEADGRLKAYEYAVDEIIKGYEAEVDEIEKSKKGLEEQLKILQEQEEELEQIVENHKTVSSIVTEEIEAQISAIEDSRKEVGDYYDNLIEKLKTENEEREDAIEYEKKLANLANAQNNKVRVYDQERGWTYQVSKEALEEAENDLESYKKNQEIKALEDEKEAKLKGYDDQIKAFEDYSKEWSEIIEDIDKAEDEQLATETLGSEWREKIKNKDMSMMNSFKSSYQNYSTQLNSIVKNEINALNDSIKAKDKEIEAKKEQIQVWQDYKNEIKSAADTIKNGLEDYVEYLGDVKISEQSTNEQRLAALNEFANKYRSIIDSITDKNGQIEDTEESLSKLADTASGIGISSNNANLLGGITTGMQVSNAFGGILQALVKAFEQLFGSMPHFAKGGTAGFTGMAYLDGTPHSAETIFTAAQSKKLYDYVNAMPEFSKMFSVRSDALTGKTMDNSAHVSIGSMTVVANNPQEFANQFDKQMARYWKTKLTENKVY